MGQRPGSAAAAAAESPSASRPRGRAAELRLASPEPARAEASTVPRQPARRRVAAAPPMRGGASRTRAVAPTASLRARPTRAAGSSALRRLARPTAAAGSRHAGRRRSVSSPLRAEAERPSGRSPGCRRRARVRSVGCYAWPGRTAGASTARAAGSSPGARLRGSRSCETEAARRRFGRAPVSRRPPSFGRRSRTADDVCSDVRRPMRRVAVGSRTRVLP